MNNLKLEGKIAVITGGTSGMALASAKRFVAEGAYVYITGRDQERLNKAVSEIGGEVQGIIADSSRIDDLKRVFDIVQKEKGRLDVLFSSAGANEFSAIGEITEDHYHRIFDTNVKGAIWTLQFALPLMSAGGSIVFNGSIASIKGFPAFGVYNASKAALRSLVRTSVNDLKGRNIRVNVMSPGSIETGIWDYISKKDHDYFLDLVPRGKMGTPEEIAAAVLFLASDEASFVNGIELFVDGGTAQI